MKIKRKIIFSEYSKNDHFEATSDCRIYYENNNLVISSKQKGTHIVNIDAKTILLQNKTIVIDKYQSLFKIFYTLKENTLKETILINQ